MSHIESQITDLIQQDSKRLQMLQAVARLNLPDCYVAAGFLRNLVWDHVHGYSQSTPLNDIDVVYFDKANTEPQWDRDYQSRLEKQISLPWSVKNQARMHIRNNDPEYLSTADAMSYWVEVETAVGVCQNKDNRLTFVAPLGLESLFNRTITLNPKRPKKSVFLKRIEEKSWLKQWPHLVVESWL